MSRHVQGTLMALGAGAVVQRAAQVAATIVAARALGVAGLGELAFALQLGQILAFLADSGVRAVAAREMAANPGEARVWIGASLRIRFGLAVAVFVPYVALAAWLAPDPRLLVACGATVFPALFDLKGMADALGMTRREVRLESASSLVHVALVLALALLGSRDATHFGAAFLLSRIAYALPVAVWLSRLRGEPGAKRPGLLRVAAPLSLVQLANHFIFASDVILLRWLAGPTATGLYAAARRIATGAEVPVNLLGRLLQPHLNHAAARGDPAATLERALRACAYAILPIAAGGWIVAAPLVAALFGAPYADAGWTLRWLLATSAALGIGSRFGNMLFAQRRHRPYLVSLAAGAGVNLPLTILLIPPYGASGSAFASFLAVTAGSALALAALRRQTRFALAAPFARPLAVAALCAGAAYAGLAAGSPVAAVLLGGLATAAAILAIELRFRLGSIGAGLSRSSGWDPAPEAPSAPRAEGTPIGK